MIITGTYGFCRAGELDFAARDISVSTNIHGRVEAITLLFRHGKATGGKARLMFAQPIRRTLRNALVLRIWEVYLPFFTKLGPAESVFRSSTRLVRIALLTHFGAPPLLLGEVRPLPWSVRATGATIAFAAGISLVAIMKMGRWASEVSLTYCVLNADVQSILWRAADGVEWDVDPID